MNSKTTLKIVLNGLMIALVFLATYFTHIPTLLPGGYFNLGDAVIMVAAIILGRTGGFLAGSIGSCLADLAFGAFLFAPITFVVKGLEGLAAGWIASTVSSENRGIFEKNRLIAVIIGALIMVCGYFLSETYILGIFDKTFGLTAAVAELPFNLMQGVLSSVAGYALSSLLIKINIMRYI